MQSACAMPARGSRCRLAVSSWVAADPAMFPGQLTGPDALSTWQVKKVFSGGSTAGTGGSRGQWPARPARPAPAAGPFRTTGVAWLVTAALSVLAAGCGTAAAGQPHQAADASSSAPVAGPSVPASPGTPRAGHALPRLEARLPSRISGVALARASTTGAAIFAEFGDTAWARQMTRYLERAGKTPGDLHYAQVWDPSGALSLDAGVFQAGGIGAAALRRAIIASSVPDSPNLTTSAATIAGKAVTVVVNGNSGSALYLYDHGDLVFYVGGSSAGVVASFLRRIP
jgi:hypothetical protein